MDIKLHNARIAGARIRIPQNPGVYFFRSASQRSAGKILYIGKAANLRARLNFYLRLQKEAPPKLTALLKEASEINWEILGSEAEALIREAELIKKYRPKYNVLMRDDKQYFYVGFSKEKFPKIFVTHQPQQTKNYKLSTTNYVGPFTEGGALRSVLKTLRHAFPYCTCKKPHKRLCFNARIGRCLGFCCIAVPRKKSPSSKSDFKSPKKSDFFPSDFEDGAANYRKNISAIKQILSGKNQSLLRELKKEMHKLSDSRKYEEAGKIRDQIMALEKIFAHRGVIKQDLPTEFGKAVRALESILGVSGINRIESYDIANIHGRFAYGSMAVFADGKIQKSEYRLFKIKSIRSSNDPAMLREVIFRRLRRREWPYPQVIIVDGGRAQLGAALAVKPPSKIIALTKNRKHVGDHIFIQNRREPIPLGNIPEPLKNLILMLDSEAHRFAISHYRKLHRKRLLT
ncbi:hypothetical protein A3G55_00850 [Candidatus Giovannonibacteria bacterium RIFCSPLOWO2_12_FULL_44_25]|uniref:Excinuclease ABC subunit C n=1 Tax=Candidatus Giovannonibacteria bacterium RIFCSPHIGHO2_02_FULL_45_40 TaxID=1798337 RepID=A0A1F5WBA5_9BACT|nr:MAG: hypothetical protein A2120_00550 [Candidatus Giovannonibacteria bacterium GWA2_45_15]OGF60432.1 MAG: hypothetical protein A2W40_00220 [Candidatus Giovannonibacteria bacterium RIFCSPHIGHO2_01_45_12]OGF60784.1 MAG: hypothetical protein A2656_03515 [Candidatus Giovannonibacteria bacterium RIFCSPHIGHO2_01_FULL_44_100]OGF72923.1 MAG: hypothetical protein A3C05_02245 [Candidatus Giovannonibacteria bacterium RIFCSPHIGHO2_02_FULL_45_40]OGF84256.1 MAG: hypothetical protein A3A19_03490 [Candidatu